MNQVITDLNFEKSGFLLSVTIDRNSSSVLAVTESLVESKGGESKQEISSGIELEQVKPRKYSLNSAMNKPTTTVIPSIALLCCGQRQCDTDVFSAINESGLVYDGGIVVDEVNVLIFPINIDRATTDFNISYCIVFKLFRTVDSNIYAIGNFTRFSRVYKNILPHFR